MSQSLCSAQRWVAWAGSPLKYWSTSGIFSPYSLMRKVSQLALFTSGCEDSGGDMSAAQPLGVTTVFNAMDNVSPRR